MHGRNIQTKIRTMYSHLQKNTGLLYLNARQKENV